MSKQLFIQPESEVLSQCLAWLRLMGVMAWRQNQGAVKAEGRFVRFASRKGISDIIGVLPDGRFLAVECKRSRGGRLSPDQQQFLADVAANNGVAIVATSLQDMITILLPLLEQCRR